MDCLLIDPALREVYPIRFMFSASDTDADGRITDAELCAGYLMCQLGYEGFNAEIGNPHDVEELLDQRPLFVAHAPLLVKSYYALGDLPEHQWCSLRLCGDHQLTITNRTLVYAYDPLREWLIKMVEGGVSLRDLHSDLHPYVVDQVTARITWGSKGNCDLVPAPADPVNEAWDFQAHYLRGAAHTSDAGAPTADPRLREKFFGGGQDHD